MSTPAPAMCWPRVVAEFQSSVQLMRASTPNPPGRSAAARRQRMRRVGILQNGPISAPPEPLKDSPRRHEGSEGPGAFGSDRDGGPLKDFVVPRRDLTLGPHNFIFVPEPAPSVAR